MLSVSRTTVNALTPLTLHGNVTMNEHPSLAKDASVPLSASVMSTTAAYSAPFAAVCSVQPLLLGQPLPQGVVAVALALPAPQHK